MTIFSEAKNIIYTCFVLIINIAANEVAAFNTIQNTTHTNILDQ